VTGVCRGPDRPTKDPLPFDEDIYELRRAKLKQIEALGQRAYPTKYDYTHTIPQILTENSAKLPSFTCSRADRNFRPT